MTTLRAVGLHTVLLLSARVLATPLALAAAIGLLLPGALEAQETPADAIAPAEAHAHVGERATVCGVVASATYAVRSRGRPTFLNLDRPYPDHVFTAVVWGENRDRFPEPPETTFRGRRICVTRTIAQYRGRPQIVVRGPDQIRLVEEEGEG